MLERLLCIGWPIKQIEIPFAFTQSKHVQCFCFLRNLFKIASRAPRRPKSDPRAPRAPRAPRSLGALRRPKSSKSSDATQEPLDKIFGFPSGSLEECCWARQEAWVSPVGRDRRPGGVLMCATRGLGGCWWSDKRCGWSDGR